MEFNFGPIARTVAGSDHDAFNLAALPLHVSLDALMAAKNRDEFVGWLWHDLFKPAFDWQLEYNNRAGKYELQWHHIPGIGAFQPAEAPFASLIKVPLGLVSSHHFPIRDSNGYWLPRFRILEADFMSMQAEQMDLGKKVHYLQLTLAVEPAMTTAVVRAVVADSFIGVITQGVAKAVRQCLSIKNPLFSRVRFVFETDDQIQFSKHPTGGEIWDKVGQRFDVKVVGDELLLKHVTPVTVAGRFDTEVVVDLSGRALTPEQMMANVLSLAEMLVVYQDSRTVILAIPQPEIYKPDIRQVVSDTLQTARDRLKALDVRTVDGGVDLLEAAFAAQVEIREVPDAFGQPSDPQNPRPISLVASRPAEKLHDFEKSGRRCRLCGSAFKSKLPVADMARPDFTDAEHIGLTDDSCPLCRIYWCNTHQYTQQEKAEGAQGMRKALRGSYALILPTSRFDVRDMDCHLIERPPLDIGGRFDLIARPLQRVTVTQQEFALFTQMSRRIIAGLWRKIDPTAPLPLPYLGGILLTQREKDLIQGVLPTLRGLFDSVTLRVYPFEAQVAPSIELGLEVVLQDREKHHTKHTYLKSRPTMLTIHPDSRLLILADNAMQIEVSRAWFAAYDQVATHVNQMSSPQRKEWMHRIVDGADPVTAFYESTQTRLKQSDDTKAFNTTAAFWTAQFGNDPGQAWSAYEKKRVRLSETFSEYPMLAELFPALAERKETPDDRHNTTDTPEEADGSSAGRSVGSRRRPGVAERPRVRRQAGR